MGQRIATQENPLEENLEPDPVLGETDEITLADLEEAEEITPEDLLGAEEVDLLPPVVGEEDADQIEEVDELSPEDLLGAEDTSPSGVSGLSEEQVFDEFVLQSRKRAFSKFEKYLRAVGLPDASLRAALGAASSGESAEAVVEAATAPYEALVAGETAPVIPNFKEIIFNSAVNSGIKPEFAMQTAAAAGPGMDLISGATLDFSNAFGAGPGRAAMKTLAFFPAKKTVQMAKNAISAFNNLDKKTLPKYIARYSQIEDSRPIEDIGDLMGLNFDDIVSKAYDGAASARHLLQGRVKLDADEFENVFDGISRGIGVKKSRPSNQSLIDAAKVGPTKPQGLPGVREPNAVPFGSPDKRAVKTIEGLREDFLALIDENAEISEDQIKDILQKIDEVTKVEVAKFVPDSPSTKALLDLRVGFDDILKRNNPAYAKAMLPVAENFAILGDARKAFTIRNDPNVNLGDQLGTEIRNILNKPNRRINQSKIAVLRKFDDQNGTDLTQEGFDRLVLDQMNARNVQGSRITGPVTMLGLATGGLGAAKGMGGVEALSLSTMISAAGFALDRYGRQMTRAALVHAMNANAFRKKFIARPVGLDFLKDGVLKSTMTAVRPGVINSILRKLEGDEQVLTDDGFIKVNDFGALRKIEFDIIRNPDISPSNKKKALNTLRSDFIANEGLKIQIVDTEPDLDKPEGIRRKRGLVDLNEALGG